MKAGIAAFVFLFVSSAFLFSQDKKAAIPQFTRAELLAFADVKALLAAINKGHDYSKETVQDFHLSVNLVFHDRKSVHITEQGAGGKWSNRQRKEMEKYAVKGAVFTVENMVMTRMDTKQKLKVPNVSFSIK